MAGEIFEAKATQDDVGSVEVTPSGQFNPPEGMEDSRIFEYLSSSASISADVKIAVRRLERKVQDLNTKLEGVTGTDWGDLDSTDMKEAELVAKRVQAELSELGTNFFAGLAELPKIGTWYRKGGKGEEPYVEVHISEATEHMTETSYDEKKAELIKKLITTPLDEFIRRELPDFIALAEKYEGEAGKVAEAEAEAEAEKVAEAEADKKGYIAAARRKKKLRDKYMP